MSVREAPAAYGLRHRIKRMTEVEFVEWYSHQPELKAEWSNGRVSIHMPESDKHNGIKLLVTQLFGLFIVTRALGRTFIDGMQIRLPFPCRREPDLFFVAKERLEIIKRTCVEGPPDLALEVVSPDDPDRDYEEKFKEYEHGGVREYWLIDPLAKVVFVYVLDRNGKYKRVPPSQGKYRSRVLRGFFLREEWLWNAPEMNPLALLDEMKSN